MKKALVATFVLGFAAVSANAVDVAIGLNVDNPGPYLGGETVNVSVQISNDSGADIPNLRFLQFDFRKTDGALALGNFSWADPLPGASSGNGLYNASTAYPLPNIAYTAASPIPTFIANLPAQPATVGSFSVTLPTDLGNYVLDVVGNPNAPDGTPNPDFGAEFTTGFDPVVSYNEGGNNGLTGGTLRFDVVPEPASLGLLALGAVAMLRRRS